MWRACGLCACLPRDQLSQIDGESMGESALGHLRVRCVRDVRQLRAGCAALIWRQPRAESQLGPWSTTRLGLDPDTWDELISKTLSLGSLNSRRRRLKARSASSKRPSDATGIPLLIVSSHKPGFLDSDSIHKRC